MKSQSKFMHFVQENAFENVVWKMAAILSRPQHCLGLGHETMVCAVCPTMFLYIYMYKNERLCCKSLPITIGAMLTASFRCDSINLNSLKIIC